jgi:hypothetical protein
MTSSPATSIQTHYDLELCEHLVFDMYSTAFFTISKCTECGGADVRSGDSAKDGFWSGSQEGDARLSQYIQPLRRASGFSWWVISSAQLCDLPHDIRRMLLPEEGGK